MSKIAYVERSFYGKARTTIDHANQIVDEYAAQGFTLTLRQLFYQFVTRGLVPNTERSYKQLGEVVNNGRLAGLIDWDAIEDRTRNLRALAHWDNPGALVAAAADQFRPDKWAEQPYRPEVWIEKEALVGVIEGICDELDVPNFPCRGYISQSEMWAAGERLGSYADAGQIPIIFYLGDHDPSGIDMTRDVVDRLDLFAGAGRVKVRRLALNIDQVRSYALPPNPTKMADSRAEDYVRQFGRTSWELDALEPTVIEDLIRDAVLGIRDEDAWQETLAIEHAGRDALQAAADRLQGGKP